MSITMPPVVIGPVVVSAVEFNPRTSANDCGYDFAYHWPACEVMSVETLGVGSLHFQSMAGVSVMTVGVEWAFPVRSGTHVLKAETTLLLPIRSGTNAFALSLPPDAEAAEIVGLIDVLENAGCIIANWEDPIPLDAMTFLGCETGKSSADVVVIEGSGLEIPRCAGLCSPTELDDSGWFYWRGCEGKRQRTRPPPETNCVVCKRAESNSRIVWDCYHVPSKGASPAQAKEALESKRAAEVAQNEALWASRRDRASQVTAFGLNAVAIAAPILAGGVRLAAQGTALALEIGGDVIASVVPAANEPAEVSNDVRGVVSVAREVSEAGAVVCDVARQGIEAGASAIGSFIAQQVVPDDEDDNAHKYAKEVGAAGLAAAQGIGMVFEELDTGKTLIMRGASAATCTAVGARYGSAVKETLGDAMEAVTTATTLRGSSSVFSGRGVGTAAAHGAIGATLATAPSEITLDTTRADAATTQEAAAATQQAETSTGSVGQVPTHTKVVANLTLGPSSEALGPKKPVT